LKIPKKDRGPHKTISWPHAAGVFETLI